MEQCLSRNPDINVVYTINEPAGEGAYAALKADNREDKAFIVSIDGSCQGMERRRERDLRRRRDPVPRQDGAARRRRDREDRRGRAGARRCPPGEDYLDTGTKLVTAKPLPGIKSQTVDEGKKTCWGTARLRRRQWTSRGATP